MELPREEEFHGYVDRAVQGEVPEQYKPKPSEWTFLIVVGSFPHPEKLPSEIAKRLRECV